MIIQRTADGFRATVSALNSLVESKGVSFHTSPGGSLYWSAGYKPR
jgi:hypothetical protein